jgi:NADH-quinone oxidoreductase subunit E
MGVRTAGPFTGTADFRPLMATHLCFTDRWEIYVASCDLSENRKLTAEEFAALDDLKAKLERMGRERGKLIPILQLIQDTLTYLAPEAIQIVSEHLEISASEVYGVATFYNQFRFNPPGRHPVKVCLGTACHVKGGEIILENFERKLQIKDGQTTADREFSIDRVACVGCCALAPVSIVGETLYGKMQPSKVEGIVLRVQIEKEQQEREKRQHESSPPVQLPPTSG